MNAPTRRQRQAIVLLLVISLVFVTLDYRSSSFSGMRSAAQALFGPVQRGLTTMFAPVGRFFAGIPEAASSGSRVRELERQNAELQSKLRDSELSAERAAELRRLELLAGLGQYRVLPASVVGLGPSLGFEWTVTVDVGRQDGVQPGMTVLNGDGLVGRVKSASASTASVVLAIDPQSSVGVRLAGSNQLGVASGAGLAPLSFTPLDPQTRVQVGDRLLTGPYGGTTFVPGVPVGEVTAVVGNAGSPAREATIRPYVTFSTLDLVGIVLVGPRSDPRDAVLPTSPPRSSAPSPTSSPSPATTTPSGTP